VGVGGRGDFLFPQIKEKRRGGLGGEILLSPKLSAPYVLAYASPLTEYSGVGSGGTSISKCVSSSRQSVMSEANYTLTGGGGKKILLSFTNFSFAGKEKLQGKNLPRFGQIPFPWL
jgi:hypothetical protein